MHRFIGYCSCWPPCSSARSSCRNRIGLSTNLNYLYAQRWNKRACSTPPVRKPILPDRRPRSPPDNLVSHSPYSSSLIPPRPRTSCGRRRGTRRVHLHRLGQRLFSRDPAPAASGDRKRAAGRPGLGPYRHPDAPPRAGRDGNPVVDRAQRLHAVELRGRR